MMCCDLLVFFLVFFFGWHERKCLDVDTLCSITDTALHPKTHLSYEILGHKRYVFEKEASYCHHFKDLNLMFNTYSSSVTLFSLSFFFQLIIDIYIYTRSVFVVCKELCLIRV